MIGFKGLGAIRIDLIVGSLDVEPIGASNIGRQVVHEVLGGVGGRAAEVAEVDVVQVDSAGHDGGGAVVVDVVGIGDVEVRRLECGLEGRLYAGSGGRCHDRGLSRLGISPDGQRIH